MEDTSTDTPTRIFFVVVVPICWLAATVVSWNHPGDEYILYAVGLLPTVWILPFLEYTHLRDVLIHALVSGTVTMALIGWIMDLLRLWRLAWWVTYVLAAAGLTFWALSEYPSYERAMSKNGSLTAYIASACNVSLFGNCVVFLVIGGYVRSVRAVSRRSRA
jgi:hypothetical protein